LGFGSPWEHDAEDPNNGDHLKKRVKSLGKPAAQRRVRLRTGDDTAHRLIPVLKWRYDTTTSVAFDHDSLLGAAKFSTGSARREHLIF
jgi:hypothetical protein